MALIHCPQCGKEISDTIEACIHCGCHLPTVCPECGSIFAGEIAVCTHCGYRLKEAEAPAREAPAAPEAEATVAEEHPQSEVETTPAEKRPQSEADDLLTVIRKYKAESTLYKACQVIGIVLSILIGVLLVAFACGFSLVAAYALDFMAASPLSEFEAAKLLSEELTGIFHSGSIKTIFDFLISLFPYTEWWLFMTLGLAVPFIGLTVDLLSQLKELLIFLAVRKKPYDYGKTVTLLKQGFESEAMTSISFTYDPKSHEQAWPIILGRKKNTPWIIAVIIQVLTEIAMLALGIRFFYMLSNSLIYATLFVDTNLIEELVWFAGILFAVWIASRIASKIIQAIYKKSKLSLIRQFMSEQKSRP